MEYIGTKKKHIIVISLRDIDTCSFNGGNNRLRFVAKRGIRQLKHPNPLVASKHRQSSPVIVCITFLSHNQQIDGLRYREQFSRTHF